MKDLTRGNNMLAFDFKFQLKNTVKVIKKDSPDSSAIGVVTARAQYIVKCDKFFVEFENKGFDDWFEEEELELVPDDE